LDGQIIKALEKLVVEKSTRLASPQHPVVKIELISAKGEVVAY